MKSLKRSRPIQDTAEAAKRMRADAIDRAKRGINVENLVDQLRMAAKKWPIGGTVTLESYGSNTELEITVKRSWAVEASLSLDFKPQHKEAVTDDEAGVLYTPCILRMKFNWASTNRTLAQATAAADLYREMISLGACLEAMSDLPVPYIVELIRKEKVS